MVELPNLSAHTKSSNTVIFYLIGPGW